MQTNSQEVLDTQHFGLGDEKGQNNPDPKI